MKALTLSILQSLSDGQFHSGQELADRFGVCRATIWQSLKQVDDTGKIIFRVRGRGYRLAESWDPLQAHKIMQELGEDARLFDLKILPNVDSTNKALLQMAIEGAKHKTCVVAELQTHGRGRRGRVWYSNLGGALTFSLLWRFNSGINYLSGLSLAVGVAISRSLRSLGFQDIALKWPNDIVHTWRKLGGVLIELQGDAIGPCAVVIGIGLNIKLPSIMRQQIDQAVVDLSEINDASINRNVLLAVLLKNLNDVIEQFETRGFNTFKQEWLALHVYQNRIVTLLTPDGRKTSGVVSDITNDGALIVETANGLQQFIAGEISLRGEQ